jgi:hypothetical protein
VEVAASETRSESRTVGRRASVCRSVGASGPSIGPWERPGDGTWMCTERRTVGLLKCRHWSCSVGDRDVRWSAHRPSLRFDAFRLSHVTRHNVRPPQGVQYMVCSVLERSQVQSSSVPFNRLVVSPTLPSTARPLKKKNFPSCSKPTATPHLPTRARHAPSHPPSPAHPRTRISSPSRRGVDAQYPALRHALLGAQLVLRAYVLCAFRRLDTYRRDRQCRER